MRNFFVILCLSLFSVKGIAQGLWASDPYYESPSYRVRMDAKTPGPKVENHEQACGFEMRVQMIESDDTIGARILLRNQSKVALDLRLVPGTELRNFFKDEDQLSGRVEFNGRVLPEQMVSLFWGFEALKEEVLAKPQLDFRAEAKLEDGVLQCERNLQILRVREGIVKSQDPLMIGVLIGSSVLRTGALKDLGSHNSRFAWGIDLGIYNLQDWGAVLTFHFQDYGGGGEAIRSRLRAGNPTWVEPTIRSLDAGIMASRRFDMKDSWVATYDLGIGFSNFQFGDDKAERLTESVYALALQQRGSIYYRYKRYRITPFNAGSLYAGFTLAHHLTPAAEVTGQDVAGQSLTALFSLKFSN